MPNWIILAIPLALLYAIGTIIEAVKEHHERVMLHFIIDGDRLQSERWNRNQKPMMNHARRYC